MAAFELLLCQARRHFITRLPTNSFLLLRLSPPPPSTSPSTLGFFRRLCSSSSESNSESTAPQPEESTRKPVETAPIQVVAYPLKPEDPSKSEEPLPKSPHPSSPLRERDAGPVASANAEARNWTREDIRYVKDAPSISPVSYPAKTAPLPEDRPQVSAEVVETDTKEKEEVALEKEGEKIQDDHRTMPQMFKPAEMVPFPTIIRAKGNEPRKTQDFVEAVRLVKVSVHLYSFIVKLNCKDCIFISLKPFLVFLFLPVRSSYA